MKDNVISQQALESMAELFAMAGEYRQLHVNRTYNRRKLKKAHQHLESQKTEASIFGKFEDCGSFYQEKVESAQTTVRDLKSSILKHKRHMKIKLKELRHCQREFELAFPGLAYQVSQQIESIIDLDSINRFHKKVSRFGGEFILCLHGHIKEWYDSKRKKQLSDIVILEQIEQAISSASVYYNSSKNFNKNVHHYVADNPDIINVGLRFFEHEKNNLSDSRLEQLNHLKHLLETNGIIDNH